MSRWSRLAPPLALAAAFAVSAAASIPVALSERRSAVAEADLAESLGGPAPTIWDSADEDDACGPGCPARVAAAQGLGLATDAMQAPRMTDRLAKSRQAEALLARAIRGRPSAGEWWGWLAYARVGAAEEPADVVQALDQSYRLAPFLPHLAVWRIAQSARLWALAPPAVRRAAANETAWLKTVEPQEGLAVAVVASVADPRVRAALGAALARPGLKSAPHRIGGVPSNVPLLR